MSFDKLSAADAERYRATIEADGPIRLAELAGLLKADRVDLGEFDGSLASLVPLWSWFISFARADFPGVPADVRSRREAVEEIVPGTSRQDYASEFLVHYLFEVAKKELHDVVWRVDSWKPGMSFQRTKLQSEMNGVVQVFYALDSFCWGLVHVLATRRDEADAPENLLHRTLESLFEPLGKTLEEVVEIGGSGISILEGLGDPGPRLPPLEFATQGEGSPPTVVEGRDDDEPVGDELILAHPKADVENLERARPLNAEAVAQMLVALGYRTDSGEPITAEGILSQEMGEYLCDDNEVAVFATATYGGKLRALHVDAINPTKEQWNEIMTALNGLAKALKARLAREDEFGSSEDA